MYTVNDKIWNKIFKFCIQVVTTLHKRFNIIDGIFIIYLILIIVLINCGNYRNKYNY